MPQASKSCPKCYKSPNLVTLQKLNLSADVTDKLFTTWVNKLGNAGREFESWHRSKDWQFFIVFGALKHNQLHLTCIESLYSTYKKIPSMVEPNRRQICIPVYAWSVKYFVLENKVKRNKAIRFTLEFVEQYFLWPEGTFRFHLSPWKIISVCVAKWSNIAKFVIQ